MGLEHRSAIDELRKQIVSTARGTCAEETSTYATSVRTARSSPHASLDHGTPAATPPRSPQASGSMADLVYRTAADTGTPVDTPPPSPQGLQTAMPVADWWAQATAAAANATPPSSRAETPTVVSPRSATGAYAVGQEAPVMPTPEATY